MKIMSDLIACLYKIAEAIREKKQNENNENNENDDNENNINYTWYDFIKENCVDPINSRLEESDFDDVRNPVPVGIYDFNNGDNFYFFKDIDIKENILKKYNIEHDNYYIIYEEPPRLFQLAGTYLWGSLCKIGGHPYFGKNIEFMYSDSGYELDSIEYNGKTYYYSYFMGD